MSSLIKRAALDALKDELKLALSPSFGLHYLVGAADPEDPNCFPSIAILPGTFTFEPDQEEAIEDESVLDRELVEVGTFSGTVEIRLSAKSKSQREEIEDAILNVFLSPELRPGILALQTAHVKVAGWATLHKAIAAFSLDKEEWREEFAFSKKRYTFLDVGCWYPALVMRAARYRIEHMIMAWNKDLESDVPDEKFEVDEDGNFAPSGL